MRKNILKYFLIIFLCVSTTKASTTHSLNQEELLNQHIQNHTELPQYSTLEFSEYNVPGDGDCAFHAFGITRDNFIKDVQTESMWPEVHKEVILEYLTSDDFRKINDGAQLDYSPGGGMFCSTLRTVAILYYKNFSVLVTNPIQQDFFIETESFNFHEGSDKIFVHYKPCHFTLLVHNEHGSPQEHERGQILEVLSRQQMESTPQITYEELLTAGFDPEEIAINRSESPLDQRLEATGEDITIEDLRRMGFTEDEIVANFCS